MMYDVYHPIWKRRRYPGLGKEDLLNNIIKRGSENGPFYHAYSVILDFHASFQIFQPDCHLTGNLLINHLFCCLVGMRGFNIVPSSMKGFKKEFA